MDKKKVIDFTEQALAENNSLFLIGLDFMPDGKIAIVIDGDEGVPLSECIRVSRSVEANLDREEEDFSLEVSSPDITKPLTVFRQYKKNIGRTLSVKTKEEKIKGTLVEASDEKITLEWSAREPKPIGKGKVTVVKKATIAFDQIVEAKVKLIF
ncbi:MAG: ribosome assembly cofactor RimP [Flavicella sp.]